MNKSLHEAYILFLFYLRLKRIMLNYQQELAQLSDSQKISLWSKWEKSNLSKESKIRSVYYDALSKGYLTK